MTADGGSSERGFGPPIGAILGSVLGVIAWLVFIILYALEWSRSYSLFENFIVTVASFLIMGLLIAVMWIIWIFRTGKPRYWWNAQDQANVHDYGRGKDIPKPGQRFCGTAGESSSTPI